MYLAERIRWVLFVVLSITWIGGCGSDTADDPCAADGVCSNHGSCDDSTGVALCSCDPGYAGEHCERCAYGYLDNGEGECVRPNRCAQSDCAAQNRACENQQGQAVCTGCLPGFHEEDSACVPDTVCQPSSCSGHGDCDDTGGELVCTCHPGYAGTHCQDCAEGYYDNGLGECVASDPCAEADCEIQHRQCENQGGLAVCTDCLPGYHEEGEFCVEDTSCQPDSCNGHGECQEVNGQVVCLCDAGYAGDHCETCAAGYVPWPQDGDSCVDDPCLPDPCDLPNTQEDACVQTGAATISCLCIDGFSWDGQACVADCDDPDGDGYGSGSGCLGTECDESDPSTHQDAPEICDGNDNDCNGTPDDGDPGGGGACDTGEPGVCAAGTEHCLDGQIACVRDTDPSDEVCDNLDNNCDGTPDDGDPEGGGACDTGELGVCAAGTEHCLAGEIACVQDTDPSGEICDNLDNDCNGTPDDGDPGGGGVCDTGEPGVCAPGTEHCLDGEIACLRDVDPSGEICDNLDNDCDGTPDDGDPGGGASCATGEMGVCAAGTEHCLNGQVDCYRDTDPSDEICDGLDNDCDGTPDDGDPDGGQVCETSLLGVCAAGTTECQSPLLVCLPDTTGEPEICGDSLDNDCDGTTDNGCCLDVIQDGGMEAGTPSTIWYEESTNFGTPICTDADCGSDPSLLPYAGTYWAWFGGISDVEEVGVLSQEITIPAGTVTTLKFQFEIPACDDATDSFEITLDGTQVFATDATDPRCDERGYQLQTVDVSDWADGAAHTIELRGHTNSTAGVTNFFVDDIVVESCIP